MGIKRKTYDIQTWEKHLFLDISPTNTDTLVPSRYQCVETRSIEVFWLLSQPLPHLRFNFFVISETFTTQLLTVLRDKHFPSQTGSISLWIFFSLSPCAQRNAQQNAALWLYTPQARSPFWLLKPASEHAHAHALQLPRLSWSWTVLLPTDTHRKHITSITAVLLPFVTYLLTLPRSRFLREVSTHLPGYEEHNMNHHLCGSLKRGLACSLMYRRNCSRSGLRSSNVIKSIVSVFVTFSASSKHSHQFGRICNRLHGL
jgi:hypothetical protein